MSLKAREEEAVDIPAKPEVPETLSPPAPNDSTPNGSNMPQPTNSHPPAVGLSDSAHGEIVVTGVSRHADPLKAINIESFHAIQSIDKTVFYPIATVYRESVPEPAQDGLRNFLRNLETPVTCINFVLQHKVGKAAETLARFAINTTIGLGGLIDVSKRHPFAIPYRMNGFANTMGFYGVKPGAYLYLPIIGATTVRDLIGRVIDFSFAPVNFGKPFDTLTYSLGAGAIHVITDRNDSAARVRALQAAINPYTAFRVEYLARRKAEIEALHTHSPKHEVNAVTAALNIGNPAPGN